MVNKLHPSLILLLEKNPAGSKHGFFFWLQSEDGINFGWCISGFSF
jgi:hypothetical protein